jgi:ABC-type nitrate/sulfonate/bicarbonate transport system substrate-binding protein
MNTGPRQALLTLGPGRNGEAEMSRKTERTMAIAMGFGRNLLRIAAMACIAAAAITGPGDSATAEKLRVGINLTTIETLPIYLAADGGDAVELTGGALPSLTEGKVDAATNAETQALLRSTANPEIRVILTVAEYSYRIVARRSAGIRTAADLRGKKIATSLNSSAHFYIVKTLRGVGLSEKDVTIVGVAPTDMPAALARGDVDAVSIWEPAAENSVQALGSDAAIIRGPAYRERFNLNTTAAAAADPVRRAALVDLLRSLIRTSQEAHARPESAQLLIAGKLKLPPQIVSTTWNLFRFPASLPDDLLDSMVEQEPWMAEKQSRAARPREAIAALIDASLWREAQAPR